MKLRKKSCLIVKTKNSYDNGEDIMGLFDDLKEASEIGKNHEWKLGIIPALITVEDNYIYLKSGGKEVNIFYKDIQKVENKLTSIEIKTITDKYQLNPRRIRGAKDKTAELYAEIIEKMNQQKAPQDIQATDEGSNTASFCSSCGQKLEANENFCPNCGAKTRKL